MQMETFEWKMELLNGKFCETTRFSPYFHFRGYYCRLYCMPMTADSCYSKTFRAIIGLKGHAAHFYNKFSCDYSLSSKDNFGAEQFSVRNTMHISSKDIDAQIFDGYLFSCGARDKYDFMFSWYKNMGVNATAQENCVVKCATQVESTQPPSIRSIGTKTENRISVVECATQTENTQPPSIRSIGTETENVTNLLEHATTKETTCPFATAEHYTFLETLSNDFGRFYEDKTDTDCVLKVDKVKFPVHRFVLVARSSVFAAMFHHDMSERRNGEVDILDVNADALSDIIFFMYTGKIRGLSPDTAAAMYTAADKYSLIELRVKCLDFLIHNLTVDNICDAALVAHMHAEAELENKVVQFVKVRMQELMENEKWRDFSATHFLLANKLLSYALIANQTGNI